MNFDTSFPEEEQKLLISYMIKDPDIFTRVKSIIKVEYFDRILQRTIKYILEYSNEYSSLPSLDLIKAHIGLDLLDVKKDKNNTWCIDRIEEFCKYNAFKDAISFAIDKMKDGDYDLALKNVKDAVLIGLQKDLGIDYFKDPEGRLIALRDNNGIVSTGWKAIDKHLFGGFNRGELNIFAGISGSGKSLFLQNLGLNWVLNGLNVVYVTLELNEKYVASRIDSMFTGVNTSDVYRKVKEIDDIIKLKCGSDNIGTLQIKYLNAQSTVNDVLSYVKEYMIQTNIEVDAILVDYLDLMSPNSKRVAPSDLFVRDKFISEELRALANDLNCLLVSASQLNRSATQEQEYDFSHIAGGISKINTADNVISIKSSKTLRERGIYQIKFLKTRSSAGVDKEINLHFNINTLRIKDIDESESNNKTMSPTDIQNLVKNKKINELKPARGVTLNSLLDLI